MASTEHGTHGLLPALSRLGRLPLLPLSLLVLQLALVYGARYQTHGFKPAHMPDTRSYLELARATSLEEAVSHYRTYGYPLFLRLVGGGDLNVARVPRVQFALYSLAVLLLWLALRRYSGSAWLAFAGTTPLAYLWVVDLMPQILTDVLAVTVTIAVVSLILLLATRPWAPLIWAGLALSVFAAYQIRPSLVFLVAWVPLAATVLRLCRERRAEPGLLRWLLGLALVTVLPYLLFAGMRHAVVGHFGLVPFGGTNLAGVTACFLDDTVARQLPEEQRPVARNILRIRQRRGLMPMTVESDPFTSFGEYSLNMWEIALPAAKMQMRRQARRRAERGQEAPERRPRIERNDILTRLSRSIIRLRPLLYLRWVRSSILYGLRGLGERPWILWPFVLLSCSTPLLLLRGAAAGGTRGEPPEDRLLLGLLVMGVSYFLTYLLLHSLVSWPSPRYATAMILFLPSVLCMLLFAVWRRILARRGRTPAPTGSGARRAGSSEASRP